MALEEAFILRAPAAVDAQVKATVHTPVTPAVVVMTPPETEQGAPVVPPTDDEEGAVPARSITNEDAAVPLIR